MELVGKKDFENILTKAGSLCQINSTPVSGLMLESEQHLRATLTIC